MISKNDTVILNGIKYLVTTVRNGGVHGVAYTGIDESGSAGSEMFLGSVECAESGEWEQTSAAGGL